MAPFFIGIAKNLGGFGFSRSVGRTIQSINTYTSPSSIFIPPGTTNVLIKANGAWGGYPPAAPPPMTVAGGYVEGQFTTLAGKLLNVSFAGGGNPGSPPLVWNSIGNYGGNYAGVFDGPVIQSNSLIIAGGGGGTGSYGGSYPAIGGAGGGTTGGTGTSGFPISYPGTPGTGGTGGSQVSGGTAGSSGSPQVATVSATSGSALQGGTGGWDTQYMGQQMGGGGGGGYYGGGGGGGGYGYPTPFPPPPSIGAWGGGSGGGGGSSYIHPTATSTVNTQGGSTSPAGQVQIVITELLK